MATGDPSHNRKFAQRAPGEPLMSEDVFTKEEPTREKLLALLGRVNARDAITARAATTSTARKASPYRDDPSYPSSRSPTEPFTQFAALAQRQPTQQHQSDSQEGMSSATNAKRDLENTLSAANTPQRAADNDQIHTHTSPSAEPSHGNILRNLARQCDWMQGIDLTREEFRPDYKQAHLLQKDESWQKPAPGKSFPAGNIPISILTMLQRLADEDGASGARPDSDDEMEEDPTQDSIEAIEDVHGSRNALNRVDARPQGPPLSSMASWSPTPTPPRPPTRVIQNLPPDSSFDHGHTSDLSPRTPRAEIPPSSPPTGSPAEDMDDDMEMDSYIPQALGDDIPESPLRLKGMSKPSSVPPSPVVQVKETPHFKEWNSPVQTTLRQAEIACEKPHNTPKLSVSRSVVQATYKSSPYATGKDASTPRREPSTRKNGANIEFQLGDASVSKFPDADELNSLRIVNSSTPPNMLEASKRKFNFSPSKKTQKAKRQEIKHGNFGEGVTSSVDPALAVRRHREESFRQFKEMRRLKERSTKTGIVDNTEEVGAEGNATGSPELDVINAKSPTQLPQRQIFHDLGAIDQEQATDHVPVTDTQCGIAVGQDDSSEDQRTPSNGPLRTVFARFKAAYPEYVGDERHFAGQCGQIYVQDAEDRMVSKWQWDDYIIRNLTVYKDYALDCLGRGVDPDNWLSYYKDHVLDTLYHKNVMNRETVIQALNEFGTATATTIEREQLPQPLTSVTNGSNDNPQSALAHHDDSRNTNFRAQLPRPPRRSFEFGRTRTPLAKALDARADASPERIDPYRSFLLASAGSTPLKGSARGTRGSSGGGVRPN